MEGDLEAIGCIFVIGLFVIGICVTVEGCRSTDKKWEKAAIEHNAGYYDPQTAEFKWNDEKVIE